jgi:hypothetical protein
MQYLVVSSADGGGLPYQVIVLWQNIVYAWAVTDSCVLLFTLDAYYIEPLQKIDSLLIKKKQLLALQHQWTADFLVCVIYSLFRNFDVLSRTFPLFCIILLEWTDEVQNICVYSNIVWGNLRTNIG